jgi:hypothetical protein
MLKEQQKQTGAFVDPDREKTIYNIYTKGKPQLLSGNFFGSRQNNTNGFAKSAFK